MPTPLRDITTALDAELGIAHTPDYPGALNGLQLENPGHVTKVACAVDACLPVVEAAVEQQCDLLIVHHGLFWGGPHKITGGLYRKWQRAIQSDLAIYSAHLPLDIHPTLGNNALLAESLGLPTGTPFFPWKGIELGLHIQLETHLTRDTLAGRLAETLGSPAHLCPGGPETISRIGILTGGAGSEIHALAQTGIDTIITGEGPHWSYTAAEELGINLFYGGHYATETFGVRALGQWLEQHHKLPHTFINHPTGL